MLGTDAGTGLSGSSWIVWWSCIAVRWARYWSMVTVLSAGGLEMGLQNG